MSAGTPVPDAAGDYLRIVLDKDFTAEQMAVITAGASPQLVIAGAGSGKTMVMAARIVHAVAWFGVPPSQVLGLTFTNKAAGELAERVRQCLTRLPHPDPVEDADPAEDDVPTIATYNAYAQQLVRDHALRIGREPGATLLTEAVQWQLAMRVATRAPGPFSYLKWTTPYVADLVVSLAGDLSDHLASAESVRAHDERVRAEIEALTKPVAEAREIIERTYARDELLGLVASYAETKRRLDLIDFGDQVALACAIAEQSPEVVAGERARFSLVVLDEYQDTGVAQRELLRRLFGDSHSVTAVGDPHQSIYGWRGASASNLSRFGLHFAGADAAVDVRTLMTSFRCDGRILEAANVIARPLRAELAAKPHWQVEIPELTARPGAQSAGEVVVSRSLTAIDEAQQLADRIAGAIADDPARAGTIAVLARRRMDFARLHQAMVERNVPVEVVGLGGLLAMPEVSDIVAVLSLLADSTANPAAVRLLTGPRWRLGVRDLAALGERAAHLARLRILDPDGGVEVPDADPPADRPEVADEPAVTGGLDAVLEAATSSVDPVEVPSLLEAAESPGHRLSEPALERLRRFVAEIRRLRGLAGQPIVDLITEVIASTGLDVEIEAGDPALAVARLANVHAFLDVAGQFAGIDGEADLVAFLAYLRAAADNEDGLDIGAVSAANTVKLMTVHAAKGLEWDIVAVPGLVDKVFPSDRGRTSWTSGAHVLPFRCRGDVDDLPHPASYSGPDLKEFRAACRADSDAEERRLAYVAMTRAAHRLWLSGYVWSPTRKEAMVASPYLAAVKELGEPSVSVDGWADDPAPGAVNPLLALGVADVPWPAELDPADLERRRRAAALVAEARTSSDSGREPAGAGAVADSWRRDAGLLLDEARRRRVRTVEVGVPERLTTSQIVALGQDPDRFAASLARPVPTRPVAQARRGSRFHQWVEDLYRASPLLEPDDLPGSVDLDDLSDEELAALQERFLADGWGERQPAAVEAGFEMVVGGRLVRGRIDAVYRDEDDRYDVIDYKTGAIPTGRDFDAAALQLSIYRLAWADLAGVDPSAVTAGFLYVRTGLVKRPDRLLDRDELATILSASA